MARAARRRATTRSRTRRTVTRRPQRRALQPSELAWIAALPCALLILAGIVVVGPAIGHAFARPGSETLWPREAPFAFGKPEPAKHGRYLVAMLGPPLLTAIVLAGGLRTIQLRPPVIRALILASQLAALGGVAAALLGQHDVIFHGQIERRQLFTVRTVVVAAALALGLWQALRSERVRGCVARHLAETRVRAAACLLAAAALTALWLLTAINTDGSIGSASWFSDLPPWAMGDAVAVLDGRTPLVNYHALYGQLWGYVGAAPLAVFGDTITVFTIAMTGVSALVLLAIYSILRRVVRSSPLALALYLPFLATSLFMVIGPAVNRATNGGIFSVWPMRYSGPYLLAWLTARHLDGAAPRRTWPLFLAAGVVAVNNVEFGLGAVAATFVALACTQAPLAWRPLARLAAQAAGGLLGAALLVSLLTLVRAGALPRFSLMLEYPRLFGVTGWVALPMPSVGFQLVLYATFAAALCVAAVRLLHGEQERLLTGLLAWSGIFGLAAGSYYAGRSDNLKLAALFSAWALSLVLLLVVLVRSAVITRTRIPSLAALLVLFGFGLAVCSLAQVPTPWSQVTRIRAGTRVPLYAQTGAVHFIRERTRPGEQVAILLPLGHLIAYDLSLTDVSPYSFITVMGTRRQMQTTIDAVRAAHAHKIFMPDALAQPAHLRLLAHEGFSEQADQGEASEWIDAGAAR
jgi:hypothetical protein